MDEAEEIYNNIISLYDMFGENKVKYKVKQDGIRMMNEYAQQVSRENGFLFWEWVHKKKSQDQRLKYSFYELFDEWIKNQQ